SSPRRPAAIPQHNARPHNEYRFLRNKATLVGTSCIPKGASIISLIKNNKITEIKQKDHRSSI
ncbi:hypothetical protein AT251_24095, partial [Enterovibrio nigricans]